MITAAEIQLIRNADPGAVLPGIDTKTGNLDSASSLLDVTEITQNSKVYYVPSRNALYVMQAGAVLSGINFGSATVVIGADNVTIKDCTFTGTTGWDAVIEPYAYSGATVENCTFTGTKSPTEHNAWIESQGSITIEDNSFLNSPTDAIDMHSGVVTGNYFSAAGYMPGAHADAIWVTDSTGTTITDNFIDGTANADSPAGQNSDLRLTAETGSLSDVTVSGNYLLGGAYTVEVGGGPAPYTTTNVSITNNYLGFGEYGTYYFDNVNPTLTGNTIVSFTNPIYSAQAQAAYQAAGVPTANVVSATTSNRWANASGSAPTTIFGNGILGEDLGGGSGETNFVPSASQNLYAGKGANILTYLALGDGGDTVAGFDPAKDVIDLSHIDANITTPGVQHFTFIGAAPFSGAGGQVRYQLNPAKDVTYVEADLVSDAGNVSPDFTITLQGLLPLTAANFALTPAQSSADLAAGAALTYSKVKTAAGAATEYAYSNVEGRPYRSFESFFGTSGWAPAVAADDLNLSMTADELVLYDPSLTVTRSGGSESLQIGTGAADPLTYHPVETINATTSGGEHFIFSAGFGNETINGFEASGASPDTIQLATSAFSYLTPAMSQAQDLAAVLAHASSSSSGFTIFDSHSDSLTLAGVNISTIANPTATIAANPTAIHFA
jgi:hypothetical protein